MDLLEFHKYLWQQKNFILSFAENFKGDEYAIAEIKRIASKMDAINACVFPLAPLEPKPFVFTDFLKELGFVFKCVNRNTFYKKNHLLIEISNVNFSVTISGHPFFKECQIPATPEQAEFLFQSFNLL